MCRSVKSRIIGRDKTRTFITVIKTLLAATAALFVASGAAMALDATTAAKPAKVHSPESIACSKEADAKNLHGNERKKFRADCKKKMKAGEKVEAPKATTAPAPKAPDAKAVTAPKKN